MSGVTPTPGPWRYEYENSDQASGGCWYSLRGPDGRDLLSFPYNGPRSGGKQEEANAQLAAAAPDLLAALYHATNVAESYMEFDEDSRFGVAIKDARAAIAKATGEAR